MESLKKIANTKTEHPYLDTDIEGICEKAKVWFAPDLKTYLSDTKNPKHISDEIGDQKWEFDENIQMFCAKNNDINYKFDCFTGKLLENDSQTGGLPEKLLVNDTFNLFFPKESREPEKLNYKIEGNKYHFTMAERPLRRITFIKRHKLYQLFF